VRFGWVWNPGFQGLQFRVRNGPQTEGLATLSLGVLIVPGIRDPETRVPTPLVWDRFREGWFGPPSGRGVLGRAGPDKDHVWVWTPPVEGGEGGLGGYAILASQDVLAGWHREGV